MDGKAIHRCLHVLDLEKSIAFYEKALGMTEIRRMGPEDGSWTNVFMGSDASGFQLELTWNRGRTEPYDNGGRDSHLAFTVDDYEAARALHEEMGCICHVNEAMGLYFIEDPDGCWLEILPNKAEFAPQAGVDVLDAMARRRSLRRYSGEPVPQALLDRILEAGLRSASCATEPCWTIWPNAASRARPCSPEPTRPSSWWPTRRAPTPGWKTAPSSWPICIWKRRPPAWAAAGFRAVCARRPTSSRTS